MRDLLQAARTKLGLAIGGAALLAVGVGVGAAAVAHPATSTVSDVAPVVTDTPAVTTSEAAASTSAAPTSSAAPVAVAPKVAQAPANAPEPATVETVTTPDPAPAEPTNDPSIGTIGPNGNYVPAAPIQSAGGPPPGKPLPQPVAPCLPGETSARCTTGG